MLAQHSSVYWTFLLVWLAPFGITPIELLAETRSNWLVGEALDKQLIRPVGVRWKARRLRPVLARLASNQSVAIMLDRRVDPDQPVQFAVSEVPLELALRQLAMQLNASSVRIGPVIYIGPVDTTKRMPALVSLAGEEAEKLPPRIRKSVLKRVSCQWNDLAEPADLVRRLIANHGLSISFDRSLPHDLWPAVSLPPLTLIEKLTLVLAGFDLTFRFSNDGRKVILQEIPDRITLRRVYAINQAHHFNQIKSMPGITINRNGRRLEVRGSLEQHEAIARLIGTLRTPVIPRKLSTTQKRYTLRVENERLEMLVRVLAKKLDLELTIHPDALQRIRSRHSTFFVEEATRHELIEAALAPAAVDFEIRAGVLSVSAQ